MLRLLRRTHSRTTPARVPDGVRVYAVGDVHGRIDLLTALIERIEDDAASAPDLDRVLVFLGDYVDRGPDSRAVVERLAGPAPAGFGAVHIKGNHDATMLRFLEDTTVGPDWFSFGGLATLHSYGIRPDEDPSTPERLARLQERLRHAIPPRHLAFLRHLRTKLVVGDYAFVHAGVRPGVPLDGQSEEDLLWIREPFLSSNVDFGKVVVHGHTIAAEPVVRRNRIGIDTGAYASGRLTCLVLEGSGRRFLST